MWITRELDNLLQISKVWIGHASWVLKIEVSHCYNYVKIMSFHFELKLNCTYKVSISYIPVNWYYFVADATHFLTHFHHLTFHLVVLHLELVIFDHRGFHLHQLLTARSWSLETN